MNIDVSKKVTDHIDNLPGIAACRDRDCIYRYTNEAYGKIHGLQHHLDIVGATSSDLPSGAAACAALFDEQDRQVMSSGKEIKILDIHPYANGEWSAHLYVKKPWLNDQQEIIGTIGWGMDITHAYTTALSTQLTRFAGQAQNSFTLTDADTVNPDSAPAISLSPRESEVLFLILRGKTAKLAASVLGLSYRTVEQYMESIKLKFGVRSKVELIDAAMARGYLNHIPVSIFSKQLSVILAID